MAKLAVICTHPVQYLAPAFQQIARKPDIDAKVFFGWKGPGATVDPGFGQRVEWDVPLLDGYEHEFLKNVSRAPGSHHFRGIDLPSLPQRIIDWQADAILVYGWCYKSHLGAMRYFKTRIPILFRGDSTLLNDNGGFKTRVRRTVLRWVYRHIDLALSVGTNNRAYFRALGLQDSQIIHAPHAIDNERFAMPVGGEPDIRKWLGIADTSIVILFSGKLESIKAPELLMQSFMRLNRDDAHLVFVGSGPLERSLKCAGGSRIHFLGFQNQSKMPHVYRAADLVVLPSKSETWGLALNEAMACGRAVLATDRVGAAIDLIEPRKNGWIVRANDINTLHAALDEAVRLGREGLGRFGAASSDIIKKWTISAQAEAIAQAVNLAICLARRPIGS